MNPKECTHEELEIDTFTSDDGGYEIEFICRFCSHELSMLEVAERYKAVRVR